MAVATSDASAAADTGVAHAVCCAMRRTVALLDPAAIVTFTSTGRTSLRAARERPAAPILSLTSDLAAARRLALAWGVHSLHAPDVADMGDTLARAGEAARREGFARPGEQVVVVAGVPFGQAGSTNLMCVAPV